MHYHAVVSDEVGRVKGAVEHLRVCNRCALQEAGREGCLLPLSTPCDWCKGANNPVVSKGGSRQGHGRRESKGGCSSDLTALAWVMQ